MAAIVAAALFQGGSMARALTDAPNAGWFFTPADETVPPNTPDLPFGFVSQNAMWAASAGSTGMPFAANSVSPLGALSLSGYTAAITVPHLLSGGLVARDGPVYTVRDLEIVDRVSNDVAIELGYNLDAGGRFDLTDVRSNSANDGIFLASSDLNPFFGGLADSAYHAGAAIGLGDGLSFNVGELLFGTGQFFSSTLLPNLPQAPAGVLGFDRREAETAHAGMDWKFAPWGGLGLVATHSAANNGFLGAMPPAGLSLAKASTSTLGASGRIAFGSGWVTTFSYNEGVTQLDLRPVGNILAADSLRRRSYGLAIAKHGLFGDDALGIAVSRPLVLGVGGIDLGDAATADPFDGFISSATRPILGGQSQETDLQLGYVTTFMDGALALQANAGYQMNAAGQSGNNGVTVLSRAKINF